MLKRIAYAAATALALTGAPASAERIVTCLELGEMIGVLRDAFGESPTIIMADPRNNASITFFTNTDTMTWTLVRTPLEGDACIMAYGPDWTTPAEILAEREGVRH